jgi:hypothetical protein
VVFLGTKKKAALTQTCTDPTKMARVDLREVKSGGPAASEKLCMAQKKIPCPHTRVAALKAVMKFLSTMSSGFKTTH